MLCWLAVDPKAITQLKTLWPAVWRNSWQFWNY